jgi:glycosyltransferase involved in cell wall biosynthesis
MKKVCFVMTDSSQFNILCRDQLEYFAHEKNVDLTLVCGNWSKEDEKLKSRNVGRVIVFPIERKISLFKDFYMLFRLFFFFIFNRFDAIVYSSPKGLLLGSLASFMAFHPNRVALIRGRAYENFRGKKRLFFSSLDKLCLMMSNKVIFISDTMRKDYVTENIISFEKAFVIGKGSSNGVNIKKYFPIERKFSNEFNILVIGRVCRDKGIFDVYEVLNRLNNTDKVKVKIVGRIEDEESKDMLEKILKDFSFVKYYEHSSTPQEYFQQADLHLFLTHRDGFGNVAIEAACCGTPTFCYDISGLKDSVEQDISGKRFAFQDFESIASEIEEAAENKLIFLKTYEKAPEWASSNFNSTEVWNRYLEFYLKKH